MKFIATFRFKDERFMTQLVAASLEDAKFCCDWMGISYFPKGTEIALFEMEVVKCDKIGDLLQCLLRREEE